MHALPTVVRLPEPPTDPDPITWTYSVPSARPLHLPGACPSAGARASLVAHWRDSAAVGELLSREHDTDAERVVCPPAFTPAVVELLTHTAEHFGLPYSRSSTRASIARYAPGTSRDWHVDASPDHPFSSRWTVAFSVLLKDDFAGGDLEVHLTGTVPLRPGDGVAFTSRTQHRVWPVAHGERFVLLGFGGFGEAL